MRPEMIEETALLRRHWQVEEPPSDLSARIVAHATRMPQQKPWRLSIAAAVRSITSGWNLALIPAGAVAAMLVVGSIDTQMYDIENDPAVEALIIEAMMDSDDF